MRPADEVPRLLECGNAMTLALKASPLAMRVYLCLFWGDGSEKPGIGRCGPGELADVLQSSRRAIVAALDELKSLGLIEWSDTERLAYRPGFALRFNPDNYITHTNWLNTVERLRDGLIRAQVLKDIGPRRPLPSPRGAALPSPLPSPLPAPLLSTPSASSASSLEPHLVVPTPAAPVAPEPARAPSLTLLPDPEPPDSWKAIVEAFTEGCPMLAQPRRSRAGGYSDTIETAAKAAWKREPDAGYWRRFFQRVSQSPHLVGTNDRGWRADLLWLLHPPNHEKVSLDRYRNHAPVVKPSPATYYRNADNY
tara:strand:+ start:789 stop:1715 length:927 start_codon:yes stop_codon:yes gene_type:complete